MNYGEYLGSCGRDEDEKTAYWETKADIERDEEMRRNEARRNDIHPC